MSRRKRANTVVKFPIGRVVREHRVGASLGGTPELQAIEQAAISVRRAISTLRRQQASLNLLAARASKKVTPEQHAAACAENMRRIHARENEDRAVKPLSPKAKAILRTLMDQMEADDDGGAA